MPVRPRPAAPINGIESFFKILSRFFNFTLIAKNLSRLRNGIPNVFYYTDGQKPEDYQSYTMKIGCNYAGGAKFETTYLGTTNVSVGKWLGADGNLANFENYRWKIQFNAVSGKVIYTP